ncbi:MAG: D-alanine--D-alanine ligase [bacterium]|nr:D-alanine--D-alanine ligase [bacterium]
MFFNRGIIIPMRKKRIAILMGGPSSEHDVSMKTGKMIMQHLDAEQFSVLPIKIEKDGTWPISIDQFRKQADIAFIAMHGEYGEDGQIQSLLESFKIPYTGSNALTSALAMDKVRSMQMLRANGYQVPEYVVVKNRDPIFNKEAIKNLGLPLIVKPADRGSSIGLSLVTQQQRIVPTIKSAFNYSDTVLAQQYIFGREVTCGVLEINCQPIPLTPTHIIPKQARIFNFQSKYKVGESHEITPPRMPTPVIKMIQRVAHDVHQLFGCRGMSRTDMILDHNDQIHVLEINTIPGMTETSLLPQAAQHVGIEFPRMLEFIIQSAINHHGKLW